MRPAYKSGVAAAIVAIAAVLPTRMAGEVRWQTNLTQAKARAVAANAPILMEFWSAFCAPCATMDASVFSDERVASAMSRVVPVRVDVDADPGAMRKHNVPGTPTLLLTDSYGNELFRFTGMLTLERMLGLLEEIPRDLTRINRLSATLAANNGHFATLQALGDELRAGGFSRASNGYYARALRSREAGQHADARARILLASGQNYLDLKATREAARMFETCVREHRGTPAAAQAARLLAGL